jgi:2-polyprenyl-6-methoxyphenol hydroxylase-like FAD-dependent oxidoreductase
MTPSSPPTDVLVVGAGPTGLVLALWLTRLGVRVRLIDKAPEPGTTSRALAVHARTLELYRQLGIADAVVARGLPFAAVNFWSGGKHVARAELGNIGEGLTPFPFVVIFPQDQHERLLVDQLARLGIEVERRTELVAFEERAKRVLASVRRENGEVTVVEAAYIAGCDGAHSRVRQTLGISLPGSTYNRVFYVADVELHGPVANHELHVALDSDDLAASFPMKGDSAARLIGTVKQECESRNDLTWDDVSHNVVDRMQVNVDRIHWFSTYRVHHRVAEHFARGRAFLAGDAAHIHSPVGGQGMNTGIGDAVNLAWKLASVISGEADTRLLESYEPERIAFAKQLVATTDRLFTVVTRDGPLARFVRTSAVPAVLPRLLAQQMMRRFVFRTVSQTRIRYRASSLSDGCAGSVHGGDRLPWVPLEGAGSGPSDNFTPLVSLGWQAHVYGEASEELARVCAARGVALHAFTWTRGAERAGLKRDALYLVRPDGYVALAEASNPGRALGQYLDERSIVLRARS